MAINKTRAILALLSLTWYFSCAQPKHKINPEARKLNDSAVYMIFHAMQPDSAPYKNAINLLNRAIKIDSNYYIAYQNRFAYQTQSKQYSAALESAKHMLKTHPDDATILALTGCAYERAGDQISASRCYNNALSNYQKILDTMSIRNRDYCFFVTGKASALILLNKNEQSYAYLKEILQKDTNPLNKQLYEQLLADSRNDILYGKTVTASENANPLKH